MKRLLTLALAVVPLLGFAQDDMYFTPSKKAKTVKKETVDLNARTEKVEIPVLVDYHSSRRSADEYNRRYSYNGSYQNAGGEIDTTLASRIDTVYVSDYDMEDPELDYRYSRRLVRFHSPRYYSMMCSPYYWDLMYGYGAWDYLYDPYDPWYWHYGWGYGWSWGPWDCWYGGIWGWHSPYHWSYWGWGPGWGHIHGGVVGIGHNVSHRPRGHYATTSGHNSVGGTRVRTNALAGGTRGSFASRGIGSSAAGSQYGSRRGTTNSRTNAMASSYRGGSYSDYANSRTNSSRTSSTLSSRTNATAASARRYGSERTSATAASRTNSNTNRYNSNTTTRSSSNTSYSSPARSYSGSSSSSSYSGGGSRGGGGFSGGGGGRSGGGRR